MSTYLEQLSAADPEEEWEIPDSYLDRVDGHWYVCRYDRTLPQIHAQDCHTCGNTEGTALAASADAITRTERLAGLSECAPCEWFVMCANVATVLVPHPILGEVPACERCAERAGYAPINDTLAASADAIKRTERLLS